MRYLLVLLLLAAAGCDKIPCARTGSNCNAQRCCKDSDVCVNVDGENAGVKTCVSLTHTTTSTTETTSTTAPPETNSTTATEPPPTVTTTTTTPPEIVP